MYQFLGFLNIALFITVTSPYWVRQLNKWFFHSKTPGFTRLLKTLRALHKPLALGLLVSVTAHGYLALGGFRLHTGSILGAALATTALFGLLFYRTKKPVFLKVHRACALAVVLFLAIHLLFPSLIYTLLG